MTKIRERTDNQPIKPRVELQDQRTQRRSEFQYADAQNRRCQDRLRVEFLWHFRV